MITEVIQGSLTTLFGVWIILVAAGIISASKNPDTDEYHAWRAKYQALFIILGIVSICSGLHEIVVSIWSNKSS